MNSTILSTFLGLTLLLVGCAGAATPESTPEPRTPAGEQCVGKELGAACTGGTDQGKEILLSEKLSGSKPSAISQEMSAHAIEGRCELWGAGKSPKPCTSIRLIARSTGAAEIRSLVITGFNFRVDGLGQESYLLETTSPGYEVIAGETPIRPGESVKIRVKKTK